MYYVSKAPFQIYACRRKKAVLSWNFFSVQEFDRYTQRPSAQRCVWSLGKAITIGNLPSWSASATIPFSFVEPVSRLDIFSRMGSIPVLEPDVASLVSSPGVGVRTPPYIPAYNHTESNHPIIKISKGSVGTPREWEKCESRKMITTRLSVCNVLSSPVNLNI